MTIKNQGGVFGRNPTFNNVTVEGALDPGTLSGYAIGTDVQAYDAGLASIAGLTTAADKMIYATASDTYAVTDITSAGRAILDDADAAAQRTTLGLGSMATQANNSVDIDGGAIDSTVLNGCVIGNVTKGSGQFTTCVATTAFRETNGGGANIANGATITATIPTPRRPQLFVVYTTANLTSMGIYLVGGDSVNLGVASIVTTGNIGVAATAGNQITLTNTSGGNAQIFWSLLPLGVAT